MSVPAVGSATTELCYAPPTDLTGAPLTLTWMVRGAGTHTIDIGTSS